PGVCDRGFDMVIRAQFDVLVHLTVTAGAFKSQKSLGVQQKHTRGAKFLRSATCPSETEGQLHSNHRVSERASVRSMPYFHACGRNVFREASFQLPGLWGLRRASATPARQSPPR